MPDVLTIVKQYLIDNDYDGLYADDCGCFIHDLAPCCGSILACEAGYKGRLEFEGELIDGIGPLRNKQE